MPLDPTGSPQDRPPEAAGLIRAAMKERGWSQRELGRRLGWRSSGRVSEVLSGRRELTLGMVRDLCEVLELSADAVVFGAGGRAQVRGVSAPSRSAAATTGPSAKASATPPRRTRRPEPAFDWWA